jgi:hypothetical protein
MLCDGMMVEERKEWIEIFVLFMYFFFVNFPCSYLSTLYVAVLVVRKNSWFSLCPYRQFACAHCTDFSSWISGSYLK